MFMVLVELAVQIYGLILVNGSNAVHCGGAHRIDVLLRVVVYVGTAAIIGFLSITLLLFLRTAPINVKNIDNHALWQTRLKYIFFAHSRKAGEAANSGSTVDDPDVLSSVARVFAEFLEDAETVPSDIMVGVVLLRRKQKRERHMRRLKTREQARIAQFGNHSIYNEAGTNAVASGESRDALYTRTSVETTAAGKSPRASISKLSSPVAPQSPPLLSVRHIPASFDDIEEFAYFYQYAEAIYGLPLFMWTNFSRGVFHLLCPWRRDPPKTAIAAIQTFTATTCIPCLPPSTTLSDRLPHADLVYLSLNGGLFRTPFSICFDHHRRTIVISVRGTLSTADVLVDLSCDLAEVDVLGLPPGVKAQTHSGMLRTARNVRDEIERSGVLKRLLLEESSAYVGYGLICCGHSLGGGVASLLAFLLRTGSYPTARAIAYSPPGCIITKEANPYFETFCTSVVLGFDMVPRLNRNTVENLKNTINELIDTCHHHKLQVLGSFFWQECFGVPWYDRPGAKVDPEDNGELTVDDHTTWVDMETGGSAVRRRQRQRGHFNAENLPTTYLPGRILYFRKDRNLRDDLMIVSEGTTRSSPDGIPLTATSSDSSRSPPPARLLVTSESVPALPTSLPSSALLTTSPTTHESYDYDSDNSDTDRRPETPRKRHILHMFVQSLNRLNPFRFARSRTPSSNPRHSLPKQAYRPVWAQPDEFQEIMISTSMAADHMPNNLARVLELMQDTGRRSGGVVPPIVVEW
ncbi:hypothetical protein DFS34DRAFT_597695 [Phlyctochytrium arcticum]|nr:hypothetical protein DFS34DRAFT_597695 [Phlyctochytrium arcticum]